MSIVYGGCRLKWFGLWLGLAMGWLAVPVFAAEPSSSAIAEGRALAAELAAARPSSNYFGSGVLQVTDCSDNESFIPVTLQIIVEAGSWRKEYEASITNGGFREKLVVIHDDSQAMRFFIGRCKFGETYGALEAVPEEKLWQSFAQTDFSLLDLGLGFFDWPKQAVVKKVVRRTQACTVLESLPATITPKGYSKVLTWVVTDNGGILLAEAYDYNQKRFKVFEPKTLKKINGRYELKEIEIRNLQTGSKTVLKFDLKTANSVAK
jgi:hypothetical protein